MTVSLFDLKTQYQTIRDEVQRAVCRVLDHGTYILGPEVEALEKNLAAYCESEFALGISCGTDALLLALKTIDIQPGDEVITTPFSFFASCETVSFLNAIPVFVDIDPNTYCIDPAKIEAAITKKTKAIMPVHIFGQSAEMNPIVSIAKKHNLHVIEDACQAIGATYKDKKVCSIGDFAALSFYPTKNLATYGEGGMLLIKDKALFKKARELRTHGEFPKAYQPKHIGMNARLGAMEAAILNVKMKYLDKWNQLRSEKAETYYKLFESADLLKRIKLPKIHADNTHVFHLYVIRTPEKEQLMTFLREKGIQSGNYYPMPLSQLNCYKDLNYAKGSLPNTEQVCAETVALPIYPELPTEHQEKVVSVIADFYKQQ